MPGPYYTLIASLPALEYFERAKHAPINRVRLERRLAWLSSADMADLRRCETLISWHSHGLAAKAHEFADLYDELRATTRHAALIAYVDHRLEMRTVISALRARRLDTPLAALERPWGLGPLVPDIERGWTLPDFGLAARHPWITHLRECIARQDALELGRAVFEREWRFLAGIAERHPFEFPEVLAYVMRRDIVARWLEQDGPAALQRFSRLIDEAIDARVRPHF